MFEFLDGGSAFSLSAALFTTNLPFRPISANEKKPFVTITSEHHLKMDTFDSSTKATFTGSAQHTIKCHLLGVTMCASIFEAKHRARQSSSLADPRLDMSIYLLHLYVSLRASNAKIHDGRRKKSHTTDGWPTNQRSFPIFCCCCSAAEVGARSSLFVEICSHREAIRATRL